MKARKPNPWYTPADSAEDARQRAASLKARGKDELDSALHTAIRFHDVLQARALLEAGANPNLGNTNGTTSLGHAIASKVLELVELLLRHGADPNLRTGLGTPLMLTIYEEQWDMMRRLLDTGADLNATGTIRSTPLHIMVEHIRDPKLIKYLLEHGADVNATDAEGLTPLDWAKRNRDRSIIRLLKAAGGKIGADLTTKPLARKRSARSASRKRPAKPTGKKKVASKAGSVRRKK